MAISTIGSSSAVRNTASTGTVARSTTEAPTSPATSTGSAALISTTLSPTQLQIIQNAASSIGAEAAGMSDYGITSGILNQIDASGEFTAAEEAAANVFINPNTGTFSFAATPQQVQSWEQQIESPINTALAIAALPVVGSGPSTPIAPISPPPGTGTSGTTGTTTTTSTTPTSSTTTGGGTTSTPSPFLQLFTTWLASQGGGGSSSGSGGLNSTAAGGTTGAGDVAGTDQPISALGAITPIGTPTSTTSTGSDAPLIIGVLALGGIGVGVWLYERHKKKKAQQTPPAAA